MPRLSSWWNFHNSRLQKVQSLSNKNKASIKLDLDWNETQEFLLMIASASCLFELLNIFPECQASHSVWTRNKYGKQLQIYDIVHNEIFFEVRKQCFFIPELKFNKKEQKLWLRKEAKMIEAMIPANHQ